MVEGFKDSGGKATSQAHDRLSDDGEISSEDGVSITDDVQTTEIPIAQKMLSAVTGSVLTSLLGIQDEFVLITL